MRNAMRSALLSAMRQALQVAMRIAMPLAHATRNAPLTVNTKEQMFSSESFPFLFSTQANAREKTEKRTKGESRT